MVYAHYVHYVRFAILVVKLYTSFSGMCVFSERNIINVMIFVGDVQYHLRLPDGDHNWRLEMGKGIVGIVVLLIDIGCLGLKSSISQFVVSKPK